MTRALRLVGAGGHGRELAWLAREVHGDDVDLTFVVDDPRHLAPDVHGVPVRLADDLEGTADFVVAVGDPHHRERLAADCRARGWTETTLLHPATHRSEHVTIGPGVVVAAGSTLTVDVRLGAHVHVNVGSTVSHDCVLGDYSTLSPGVHLAGNVHLGRRVFVGIGATVINGSTARPLVIGDDAVIAAGACVTGDVPPGALVAGVPAVRKR